MVIDSNACSGDTTTRLSENASPRDPGLPFSSWPALLHRPHDEFHGRVR